MFDLICPCLTFKYLFYPFSKALDIIVFKLWLKYDKVKGHEFTIGGVVSESSYAIWLFTGENFKPGISNYVLNDEIVRDLFTLGFGNEYQMNWMKQCIARVIYFRGYDPEKTVYIGKPNGYCLQPHELRRALPHAKLIFNIRDPVQIWPSYVELASTMNPASR